MRCFWALDLAAAPTAVNWIRTVHPTQNRYFQRFWTPRDDSPPSSPHRCEKPLPPLVCHTKEHTQHAQSSNSPCSQRAPSWMANLQWRKARFRLKKEHQGSSEHSAKLTTGPRTTVPNAEHATSLNGAELTEPRSINAAGEATLPKKIWGAADSHAGQAGWNRL